MRADSGARSRLPDPRLSLFYALNFGGIGVALPYLAVWLDGRGVDAATTGAIAASPSFAMLATTLVFGTAADRLGDWRTAIVAGSWATCVVYALLFVVDGRMGIWIVWTLGSLLMLGVVPIVDGATLSLVRRRGTAYGPIRAMGSVGFIVGLSAGGVLIERFGSAAFVPVLVGAALARALTSLTLPRFGRAPPASATPPRAAESVPAPATAILRHPGFLAVLLGSALINASHAFLYTFGLLHWTRTGLSESTGSLLWTVSVVAEVVLLWRFADIARRVSARRCLLFAGAIAALRWLLTGTDPGLPLLLALQTLHAITFGLAFIATASFISRRVDDAIAARAQALAATLTTGCMAAMMLVSGGLYERLGGLGYAAMALVCLVGIVLVAASFGTDLEDVPEGDGASTPPASDRPRSSLGLVPFAPASRPAE